HQLKPDIGASIARQWYDAEQVDVILDVPVSAVGLAVQEVARQKKKLLIVESTGTDQFTGKSCSPYGIQWAFDTHALAAPCRASAAAPGSSRCRPTAYGRRTGRRRSARDRSPRRGSPRAPHRCRPPCPRRPRR